MSEVKEESVIEHLQPLVTEELESVMIPNLPKQEDIDLLSSDTWKWNGLPGNEFCKLINDTYNEIVTWRKNLFKLPSGNNAKHFIRELTFWLEQFNNNTAINNISLKVYMVLPSLLLQKPSATSKAKDHTFRLGERLDLWKQGKLDEILIECRIIQRRFCAKKQRAKQDIARIFANLVMQGKINAALKFLSAEGTSGVLELSDSTMQELIAKHPSPSPISSNSLLFGPINHVPSTYFDALDEQMIMKAATLTQGAGGPSQLDGEQYRHILVSSRYKKEGKDLREQIAKLGRKIATRNLNSSTLEAYTACRLIPLNKDPDVRPIGIGETLRRIIGKAIMWILKFDIQDAGGSLQVANGLSGGAEAAIHAMREIFESEETDGIILVDASNAFNSINRQAALHNIRVILPQFSTILINTYRTATRLFISGGKEILSREGTTQGDNLAMAFYGLSTIILQTSLNVQQPDIKQVWLADDATAAGSLNKLKEWWNIIVNEGSNLGYFVNPKKSWLIIKDPSKLAIAKKIFEKTSINFTTSGQRHLGAAIGSLGFREEYVKEKVRNWCLEIEKLSEFALSQPHAAFSAFIHGEQHRFTYFLRTIPGMELYLEPLDKIISDKFIPNLFGSSVNDEERKLFSLPIREGGLGLRIFSDTAKLEFETSKAVNLPLIALIIKQSVFTPDQGEQNEAKTKATNNKSMAQKRTSQIIHENLPENTKKVMNEAKQKGASSWLSARPSKEHGFFLHKADFKDALALRYNKTIKNMPSHCPCGQKFNVTHAFNCKRGGFISIRHNDIRDFEATLLNKICTDVEIEPVLQPLTNENLNNGSIESINARVDIRSRGFWRRGQNSYFDVRVTNAEADSQSHQTLENVLKKHEREKKRSYNNRIMNIECGSFTPLIFTVRGSMGPECEIYHKFLASKIAEKTGENYSKVMSYIRCKLSFIIIRSALLCLRGSRSTKPVVTTPGIGNYFNLYSIEFALD